MIAAIRYAERLEAGGNLADEIEVRLREQPAEIAREALGTLVERLEAASVSSWVVATAIETNRSTVGLERNYLLRDYSLERGEHGVEIRDDVAVHAHRGVRIEGVGPFVITAMRPPRQVTEGRPATG